MGVVVPLRGRFMRPSRSRPEGVSDAELLARVAEGDAASFAELWQRYGGIVLGTCQRILRDRGVAEDAAQEAFARIWKSAGTFDAARGVPAAWISRITRNAALNQVRAREPHALAGSEPIPPTEHLAERFWLRALLGRLNQDEQVAIELAYFHDLSHTQIAERIGAPLGTVKARIRRGVTRLAELAEQEDHP